MSAALTRVGDAGRRQPPRRAARARARAVYLVDGELDVDGTAIESAQMAVLDAGTVAQLSSAGDARMMLAGGVPLDGEHFIHWNFVSSSREKIERARQAWRQQTMDKVLGETKWAPLPDR